MSSPNSPDWAANRRVLFCVGDHADEACEAWSWAGKYFLESDDDITLLRVWDPKSCSSDEDPEATPLRALIPAFMISELRRAFEIGFLLFIPFVIIDMVVASVLMSMGMMMLPPIMISLPFKLIFFVLVDGWYLVAGSLVQSFG